MNDIIKLSEHFTLHELCKSATAEKMQISNVPNGIIITNLQRLCVKTLEPLRAALGRPVSVVSGYRSMELNEAVGGSRDSQHMLGMAADIVVPGMQTVDLFDFIRSAGVPFDQIINEFNRWVHISYNTPLRHEKLVASKDHDNRTVYHEWRAVA